MTFKMVSHVDKTQMESDEVDLVRDRSTGDRVRMVKTINKEDFKVTNWFSVAEGGNGSECDNGEEDNGLDSQ